MPLFWEALAVVNAIFCPSIESTSMTGEMEMDAVLERLIEKWLTVCDDNVISAPIGLTNSFSKMSFKKITFIFSLIAWDKMESMRITLR